MITKKMVHDAIKSIVLHRFEGTNSVACALILNNGHVVVGEAHCAPGTDFDASLGAAFARDDAESKLGALLAYEQRGPVLLRTNS